MMVTTTLLTARDGRVVCVLPVMMFLLVLGGCGESGPKRVPVGGSVMLDGKPVREATIIFTPVGPGLSAAASIKDGQFMLSDLVGPTVGEHSIRINPDEAELEEATPAELAQANRRPRIPKVYQKAGKLVATVTGEPEQQLQFELSSKL